MSYEKKHVIIVKNENDYEYQFATLDCAEKFIKDNKLEYCEISVKEIDVPNTSKKESSSIERFFNLFENAIENGYWIESTYKKEEISFYKVSRVDSIYKNVAFNSNSFNFHYTKAVTIYKDNSFTYMYNENDFSCYEDFVTYKVVSEEYVKNEILSAIENNFKVE